MRHILLLLVSLFSISLQSQAVEWIPMCDTITGETIYVDQVNDFPDCCYEWDGSDWVKRLDANGEVDCSGLDTKCEDCCEFYINSNRNGIQNPTYYSDFVFGNVAGSTWSDFITAYEFQGGNVITSFPDEVGNVSIIKLCGLEYNLLTYTDENGESQEIETTCSCCNQTDCTITESQLCYDSDADNVYDSPVYFKSCTDGTMEYVDISGSVITDYGCCIDTTLYATMQTPKCCEGDWDCDGKPDQLDEDDDNDGILDSEENMCDAFGTLTINDLDIGEEATVMSSLATTSEITDGAVNLTFGNGAGMTIDGLTLSDATVLAPTAYPSTIVVRRTGTGDNAGSHVFFAENTGTNTDINTSYYNNIEDVLNSGLINVGADNVFANIALNATDPPNFSDIERIDVIYPTGIPVGNAANISIVLLERGKNNDALIAPITALDGNGDPSVYSNVVSNSFTGTPTLYSLANTIFRLDGGASEIVFSNFNTQNVGWQVVSLADLGVADNSTFYGYSFFSADLPGGAAPADYVDYTDATYFPTNTSPGIGGIDLIINKDIFIAYCDTDGDGIADQFDLDSDNDGIPDAIENGACELPTWQIVKCCSESSSNGCTQIVD